MLRPVQYYDAGLERYPLPAVILSNLAMALLIAAGTMGCWLISPVLGGLYLVFSVVMVYVVLRRLVCTHCYYYGKRCGAGWGWLASLLSVRRRPEEFNDNPGVRLAPVVYGLVTLAPVIALAVVLIREATTTPMILLALILTIGFYSAGPGRRRNCVECKMRFCCRGSMAK